MFPFLRAPTPQCASPPSLSPLPASPRIQCQESRELLSAPSTPLPSPLTSRPQTPRRISDFDTEAFPSHSHLFPSSPNGTWQNGAIHAMKHPSTIDASELRLKLYALAETASDELFARLNKACEGKDVPAMHDKVVKMFPSMALPSMREVDKILDDLCDRVQSLLEWIWRS
jgi:hypothetical protein